MAGSVAAGMDVGYQRLAGDGSDGCLANHVFPHSGHVRASGLACCLRGVGGKPSPGNDTTRTIPRTYAPVPATDEPARRNAFSAPPIPRLCADLEPQMGQQVSDMTKMVTGRMWRALRRPKLEEPGCNFGAFACSRCSSTLENHLLRSFCYLATFKNPLSRIPFDLGCCVFSD